MVLHIGGDAAKQQLDSGAVAIGLIDAGAPDLEQLTILGEQGGDVIFPGRVETAVARRHRAAQHPVGADDAAVAAGEAVVVEGIQRMRPGLAVTAAEPTS